MILQSSYPSCARGIKKRTCWEESDPKQAGSKIKAMEFSASALLINLFASKRSFKLEVYHISFTDHEKKKKLHGYTDKMEPCFCFLPVLFYYCNEKFYMVGDS